MGEITTTALVNEPGTAWARVMGGEQLTVVRGRGRVPVALLVPVQAEQARQREVDQLRDQVGRLVQAITGVTPDPGTPDQLADLVDDVVAMALAARPPAPQES